MIAYRFDMFDKEVQKTCTPQDIGDSWCELMAQLQTPLKMSCEDMLQASNDPCPKKLRDMVRGPVGINSRQEETMAPYFWTGGSTRRTANI